ncbi:MAG: dTDP-glucose 4,6-dehydratase [Candidatus Gorgyraea atricola]|nr:dTDP-glucose 4,6-dehydratase [Candidatus Gorgyraea atricola]
MRLLITGGCGFIGSNFIRYMLKKHPSYRIINLDKLTYCGRRENLKDVERDKRYTFVKGDICNEKLVAKSMKNCDAVINFAAESHVDRSISDASDFIRTNVHGVQVLLDAARKNRIKKFIQISTDETYGSIKRGSFKETSLLHPNSPYAASKAGGDHLALAYYTTFKTPVIVTRSSNNFGPYQFPEKVMPLFITNLLENKKVPLYGDGMNVRDWLYVLDNCRAIDVILHRGKNGEIYNIGGSYEIPNIKLTRMILKLLGKSSRMIKYVPDRLGHDRRYSLSSSKIKRLGWQPTKDFNAAIKETIEWYKDNKSWWKRLK